MLVTSRITPEFRWNVETHRYVASNGRFVAREAVKAATESVVAQTAQNIESVSQKFFNGEINHAQWHDEMRQNIRTMHVTQSALASGGWENMTPRDYGRSGALIREQYDYLNGMGQRIQSGYYGDDLSKNGFLNHAKQYAAAGRATYEYSQAMNAMDDLNHDEISNFYGGAEHHCVGENSCKVMNDLGWIRVNSEAFRKTWLWPGSRLCITQCRCTAKTRKSKAVR